MHDRFRIGLVIPNFFFAISSFAQPSATTQPDAVQRERLAQFKVPFVENCGQWDERVAFASKTVFGTAFVTGDGRLVYSPASQGWTVTETFVYGRPVPQPLQPAVTRVSYFHGSDRSRWQSDLPSYDEVSLGRVWPGISVALRARDDTVEKLFTVEPGADTGEIQVRVDGARSLRVERDGTLVAELPGAEVRFTKLEAWQERDGRRSAVAISYALRGQRYGFHVGEHDPSLPLVIDPLVQSTYLGGADVDGIVGLAIDPISGEVLVSGGTASADFPGVDAGGPPRSSASFDAFVARFDPTLTRLLKAAFFGGSGIDIATIAVNPSNGQIVVAGLTDSTDFPATSGGAQPAYGGNAGGLFFGGDGFVARLDPTLTTLLQATYLGGSNGDAINRIAVSSVTGEVLVAGDTASTDLPGTAGGAQPLYGGAGLFGGDGFVARLDPTLTRLLQATYLGGSGADTAKALAIEPSTGDVVVAGSTSSDDFPDTAGGAQSSYSGSSSIGYVARLNSTLSTIEQATYLGGTAASFPVDIATHPLTGEILVFGQTTRDFPGVAGGAQSNFGGGYLDAFAARLAPTLTSLLQATYLGGDGDEEPGAIAVDPSTGDVFVAGYTVSSNFPLTIGGSQPAYAGGDADGFLARLSPRLTALIQATYLGGAGYDSPTCLLIYPSTGEILISGTTDSTDFPGTAGGAQPAGGGSRDAFLAGLSPDLTAGPCVSSTTVLCLNGGRFHAQVVWNVPSRGASGIGSAVSLGDDTGYFWFFNSDNVELVLKVLDGVGLNGHYWVFYGALSDVEYTITIRDTVTGAVKTYSNVAGTLASVADTSAFSPTGVGAPDARSPGGLTPLTAEELYGQYAALKQTVAAPKLVPACTTGGPTLCLSQARFKVSVDWTVPSQGRSGQGTAVPITGDTGYFWFFEDTNVELVLKVLDGTDINGHFWVFYGALSNVQYTITVTDTQTQTVKTYTNPSGTLASVADTSAF